MERLILSVRVLVTLFIIAIVLVVNLKLASASERLIVTVFNTKCHPQKQICHFELDKFKVEISFDKNIYYLKPFNVSVVIKNKERANIKSMQIDFKMKNMNMGVNHFKLKEIYPKSREQHWQGKAILPICVSGHADWLSELTIISKKNKYIFSFPVSLIK